MTLHTSLTPCHLRSLSRQERVEFLAEQAEEQVEAEKLGRRDLDQEEAFLEEMERRERESHHGRNATDMLGFNPAIQGKSLSELLNNR